MKRIASLLLDTPLILMCGRNQTLADELRAQASTATAPRIVVGHTHEVARWMQLADFFIGKPGPGSLSEAVQQGLPVIVTRNASTMPQERWNAQWVQDTGVGVVHRSFGTVPRAVTEITSRLPEFRARVRCIDNQAVFEVPAILEHILATSPAMQATPKSHAPLSFA
jgi:1,2-diacylglycerol 3-beta-galactosyltransferase